MKEKDTIKIESYNPYQSLFPDRKIISKDTLNLIKVLRQENKQIVVIPEDGRPLEYLFRKGTLDFLADPMIVYLISIPTGIAVGLLTNAIDRLLTKKKNEKERPINVFINVGSNNQIINLQGETISNPKIKDIKQKVQNEAGEYLKCKETKSPYEHLPIPIFIEHQPRIVGWCRLTVNEVGLVTEDAVIVDKEAMQLMDKGELLGASVAGIARKSTCSICNGDYVDCEHLAGETYNGVDCTNMIEKADLVDVSLVKDPINQSCFFEIQEKGIEGRKRR